MKYILFSIAICFCTTLSAQKFITKNGHTSFKASVPSFEPVEAESSSTTVIFDTSTGDVAALIFVKSFRFKVALMEEHFNENYMDSDEFPKASFSGKVENFNLSDLSSEPKEYTVQGEFTIRGQKKSVSTTAILKTADDGIHVISSFDLIPQDFGITIPSIVKEKISEKISITAEYDLEIKK